MIKRLLWPLVCLPVFAGCATSSENEKQSIQRHTRHVWESQIGYSGVTRIGNTLFFAGIASGEGDFNQSLSGVYKEIAEVLAGFGATTDNIVKETIYTTDIEALKKAIDVRKAFFSGNRYPASTWVQVDRLFDAAHKLEIEIIAVVPETGSPGRE